MNKVELANEIASLLMDENLKGDPWMQEDENGDYVIKEEYQKQFDQFYDEAWEVINNFMHHEEE